MEVSKLNNKYIDLKEVTSGQSSDHLIQAQFYVIGNNECHIFLSPDIKLDNNTGYHFSMYSISYSMVQFRKENSFNINLQVFTNGCWDFRSFFILNSDN